MLLLINSARRDNLFVKISLNTYLLEHATKLC